MKIEHKVRKYGLRKEALKFPMMCVIGLSYICNSRCPSCPYTNSNIRKSYKDKPYMDEETFKLIADQCGKYGAWVRISGGGEPMLHPESVALIEYAKHKGAKIGLITNGSLFTEENSKRLLEAGIDMIEFSVDARDSKTYARVRKGLDWQTLLNNVNRMVSLRHKLKARTKIIASAVNQVGVDIDEVAKFWEKIVDNFQKRKYLTWGITNSLKSGDPEPYLPSERKVPCPFLFERLNIDSRGKVMVCGFDIGAKTNMGNVHDKTIKDIWLGKNFEHYRNMHLENRGDEIEICGQCTDWKYRSWKHNYWKVLRNAEKNRKRKIEDLL